MDYEWKKTEEHGQLAIGFIEVYKTDLDNRTKVLAIINYFPQLPFSNYEQIATVTFYYKGIKETITKGLFNSINIDLCEIILSNEKKCFLKKLIKKLTIHKYNFIL